MGEHYLGELTDRDRRMATAFAGGIGGTKKELCGVVSMGVAVISAQYGRTSADVDDQDCQDLAARYLERFENEFGSLKCGQLRDSGYGDGQAEPCSTLVERGVRVLVGVIEEYRQEIEAC